MRTTRLAACVAATSIVLSTAAGAAGVAVAQDSGPVRIGVEAPLTGSLADLGDGMLKGAQLASFTLNAADGLLGRQLEIVPIDDAGDPATGVTAATAAIAAGLDGVVGPYNSSVGLQTLPLYLDAGLVPMRLTSDDATSGMGYTLQPMTRQIAPVAAQALADWAEARSVVILVDETQPFSVGMVASLAELLPAAGVTIVATTPVTPGLDDYTDVVAAAVALEPDALYVATYAPGGGRIAQAFAASGAGFRCLMDYAVYDTTYLSVAGAAASACDVVGVPAPDDFPGGPSMTEAYTATFEVAPGSWSPYTYDSVQLLATAITDAGSTDAAALTAQLDAVDGWTGWTGAVTIDPATGDRDPATVVVLSVDANGAFHVDHGWSEAVGAPF